MSLSMSTALSAMMVAQRMAETASHNIANANTPGYSRQEVRLQAALPIQTTAGLMGTGVTISQIMGIRDDFLNARIGTQTTLLGYAQAGANVMREIEMIILPDTDSGIGAAIDEFFNAINQLMSNPQSDVARESVVQTAISLTETFNSTNNQLRQIQNHVRQEYVQTITSVNSLFEQIAQLNGRIAAVSDGSDAANDFIDERNRLIEELSSLIPIQVAENKGIANILFEGRLVVSSANNLQLEADNVNGVIGLKVANSQDRFATQGGALGAKMELYNEVISQYIDLVDNLALGVMGEFNRIQATGVGLQNGYTTLSSSADLLDLGYTGQKGSGPLSEQSLPFDMTAGRLYITITNEATGQMHRHHIDYDPDNDSLQSIAEKFADVPYLNASSASGFLTVTSWSGYRFDFSNKLLPDGGKLDGSSLTLSGSYEGAEDRAYTFYPLSSGTIGETPNLGVAVVDSNGRSLGVLQVGEGYVPGTPILFGDGISIAFGAGQVRAAQLIGGEGPFALSDADELLLSVDGGDDISIVFSADDFADISQATEQEVADVINAAGSGVIAEVRDGSLVIMPEVAGQSTTLRASGSAAAALGLPPETAATSSQTITALADTDTGGLLTALGINSFFTGTNSGNIKVSEHIRSNTGNIAAARTSPPGDNANAVRMAKIKQSLVMGNGTQTLGDFYAGIVGRVGVDAAQAIRSQQTQEKLVDNLDRQRQSISGVSLEEEMAKLMQVQQMFNAAIRVINAMDEMLERLTRI